MDESIKNEKKSQANADILIIEPDCESDKKLISNTEYKLKSDQSHWIVYKQEEIPNYIIEAKKRLGQIKQPNLVPNSTLISKDKLNSQNPIQENVSKDSNEMSSNSKNNTCIISNNNNDDSINSQKQVNKVDKHWLQWDRYYHKIYML